VNIFGVINYLPETIVGDDDRTMEMHRQTLVRQSNLISYSRKVSVINVALEKTLSLRRRLIVVEKKSICVIFDEILILKEPLQVSCIQRKVVPARYSILLTQQKLILVWYILVYVLIIYLRKKVFSEESPQPQKFFLQNLRYSALSSAKCISDVLFPLFSCLKSSNG